MTSVKVVNSTLIRYVSLKMHGDFFIGIRMRGECGELIVDEEWGDEEGDWTKHQYIG